MTQFFRALKNSLISEANQNSTEAGAHISTPEFRGYRHDNNFDSKLDWIIG
jgi:hypothetical protein